jgi:hypothetical protein
MYRRHETADICIDECIVCTDTHFENGDCKSCHCRVRMDFNGGAQREVGYLVTLSLTVK